MPSEPQSSTILVEIFEGKELDFVMRAMHILLEAYRSQNIDYVGQLFVRDTNPKSEEMLGHPLSETDVQAAQKTTRLRYSLICILFICLR
jgi:hypothetical protein